MSLTYPLFDSSFRLLTRADLDKVLESLPKVSDFYMCEGEPIRATVEQETVKVTARPLDGGDIKSLVTILGDEAIGLYQNIITQPDPKDRSYSTQINRLRHRVNLTVNSARGNNAVRIVMRRLEKEPWSLDKLRLPRGFIDAVCKQGTGLVMITGSTGSGKTSLLSGALRHIVSDANAHGHLVTIEDPVEYIYTDVASENFIVSQIEVGRGCRSFADGLRAAMRMHPTHILVGEIRDPETAAAAIAAARSGHKVYVTMHVSSVAEVFGRWSDFFPAGSEQRALNDLASVIDYIVYQTLEQTELGYMPVQESLDLTGVNRTEFSTLIADNINNIFKVMDGYVRDHGITHMADRLACNPAMEEEFRKKGNVLVDSISTTESIPIPHLESTVNQTQRLFTAANKEYQSSEISDPFDVNGEDNALTEEEVAEQYNQEWD